MAYSKDSLSGAGLFIAVGLVLAALTYGIMQKKARMLDRVVTVKGLVERDVVADMAVWQMDVSSAGDDLAVTQLQLENSVAAIKKFLTGKGFPDQEISIAPIRVFDRKATQYAEQKEGQARYIMQNTVVLRSSNVNLVQNVSRLTNEIIRAGVVLSSERGCNGPSFLFTKLNEIKPQMLVEATQNARKAAEQFAADSGSVVGKIKRAQQGVFSISERDQMVADGYEGGYNNCNADPNKRVRVVTTVDYYLE